MHFGLSDDQIFFQDNVKKFLEDNAPLDIIKKISDGDDSIIKTDLHKGIVNLGINNILIPEENGGLGLDLLFATAVAQSLGEGIATLPFTGSYVMAPISITYGANDRQKDLYLDAMSKNTINFGVGFSEFFGSRDESNIVFSKNTGEYLKKTSTDVISSSQKQQITELPENTEKTEIINSEEN